jgi:hypothetical protein
VALSDSFLVSHPDIAAEWHPTRNNGREPSEFTYGSEFEAIWQCPKYKTHVWPVSITSRTAKGTGCLACARLAGRGGRLKNADGEPEPGGEPISLEVEKVEDPPATEDAS